MKKVILKGSRVLLPKKSEEMYVTLKHLDAIEGKISNQITTVLLKTISNNEGIHHLNKRVDSLKSEISSKFSKVDDKFKGVDDKFKGVYQRFDEIDQRFVLVDKRFDEIDQRFVLVDKRFDEIDQRFDKLEERVDKLERRMDQGFAEIKEILATMMVKINHTLAVVEEQNARNLYVLDGYAYLISEQQKIHRRMDLFEKSKPII